MTTKSIDEEPEAKSNPMFKELEPTTNLLT